ncbi:MAG TPA: PKD domain-containing protein [Thermoplasmatales archaeon]|nr:PKD domain-containing protein [Thermoplasmatales archaeon]
MNRYIFRGNLFRALALVLCAAMVAPSFALVDSEAANGPLEADFYWQPEEPTDLQTVHFYDNSSGDPIVWMWSFGDGSTATDPNPTHRYADDGTYTVRLTVWNDASVMDTVTKTVTVANVPPVADAGGDRIVNNPSVAFNASASYDPDGSITSYYWEFGDGGTATGKTCKHTYGDDGIYHVTLNVTDDDGASNETVARITVDTLPPETNATLNGTEGADDWYRGNVTVTLNATDVLSGVNATWYLLNETWYLYNDSFVVSQEGRTNVTYYSVDNATNREDNNTLPVKIDNTPPVTNVTLDGDLGIRGWYRGPVTAALTANDTLSGVDSIRYRVNDGDWEEYDGGVTVSSSGNHTLYFYAVDNAGNEEPVQNVTFHIDTQAPTVTLTAPREGYMYLFGRELMPTLLGRTKIIGAFTAVATASDPLSGIYAVFFNLGDDVLWEDYTAPYQAELPRQFPLGVKTLSATAYDGAGNTATTPDVTYIKIL